MVREPDFNRYLPPGPEPTLESFLKAVERRQAMEREHGYAMWVVENKESGAFVGQCGFFPAEGKGPEIELAYHYNKASWNQGYGTEAATAALAHAFGPLGLERAIAVVMPGNVGSWRVAEKSGMRFAGLATYYEIPGLKKYVAEGEWWAPPQRV